MRWKRHSCNHCHKVFDCEPCFHSNSISVFCSKKCQRADKKDAVNPDQLMPLGRAADPNNRASWRTHKILLDSARGWKSGIRPKKGD